MSVIYCYIEINIFKRKVCNGGAELSIDTLQPCDLDLSPASPSLWSWHVLPMLFWILWVPPTVQKHVRGS